MRSAFCLSAGLDGGRVVSGHRTLAATWPSGGGVEIARGTSTDGIGRRAMDGWRRTWLSCPRLSLSRSGRIRSGSCDPIAP